MSSETTTGELPAIRMRLGPRATELVLDEAKGAEVKKEHLDAAIIRLVTGRGDPQVGTPSQHI